MAKPKVIVHGYVPQEAIDAAMKLAEEMGVEEINIGSPDQMDPMIAEKLASGEGVRAVSTIMTDGNGKLRSMDEGMTPGLARALAEALGMDKEWEKIPYNGQPGDSCDCPACNARRQELGPELDRDESMGIEPGRFPEVKAGPGVDVAGSPMIRIDPPQGKPVSMSEMLGKMGVKNVPERPNMKREIEKLVESIREKQASHFKICDDLVEQISDVGRLIESPRMEDKLEVLKRLQEVERIISALKA